MSKKVFVTSAMAEFLEENKEDINNRSYFMVWEKFTESRSYLVHLEESSFMGGQNDWSLEMAMAIKNGWTTEYRDESREIPTLIVPNNYQFELLHRIEAEAMNDTCPGFDNVRYHEVVSYYVYKAMRSFPDNKFLIDNYKEIITAIIGGSGIGFELEKSFALRKDSVDEHGDAVVEFLVDISLSEEGNVMSYKKDEAHKFKSKEEAGKYLPILGERWTIVDL